MAASAPASALDPTVAERHRERFVDGLEAAIREKGLASTQITDIVRHARASRRTFYRCFADKEACFIALGQRRYETIRMRIVAAVDLTAPMAEQVDQAIDAYLTALTADEALSLMFANDLPMLGERGQEFRDAANERTAEVLVAMLSTDEARRQGIQAPSMAKAVMLMAGLDAMLLRAVRRGEPVTALAPVAKDVLTRALAPTP